MICPSGPLVLGYEATMFPTFFRKNGRLGGINYWLWEEFARMNGCTSLQLVEFPMNGSNSVSHRSPLSIAMENREIYTSVDSPFLDPNNVFTYKYSVMSDFSRLVMMEGHPKAKDAALGISFYAVFEPNVLVLITACFIVRWLLDFFRKKLICPDQGASYRYGSVVNLLEFVDRFIHLSMTTLLFIFYQCMFNGNAVVESAQEIPDFRTVTYDLLGGSRRLLVDVGILMEDEYTSFGPRTTLVDSAVDRIVQMCTDNDDVILFWDDEMLLITEIDREMRTNCVMSRINMHNDPSLYPLPRLRESMLHGQPQHLIFPRNATRKAVKTMNHLLLTVFRLEMRTGLLSRRLIPARDHGTAFAAYQASFNTGTAVETISEDWKAISLLHSLYPMIGFCVGVTTAIISFVSELAVHFIRCRWFHTR